jgi:hypothetical protein
MSKRLPVPPELEHLIEKREQEGDRREQQQRRDDEQRKVDLGPLGAIESAADLDEVPAEDRRRGSERRRNQDRRKKPRRRDNK